MVDRKSEAGEPALITDPLELAEKEAENALAQFDWGMEELDRWLSAKKPKIRVSTILDLHRIALQEIHRDAGNFRPAGVAIKGSEHEPVTNADVPRFVEEMIEYLDSNWDRKTAIHLSAYVMWRLNWIHPFSDGNGRTSRIFSYMILCAKMETQLPGDNTIPEQVSENKVPYYKALEFADAAYKSNKIDLTEMEELMEDYLANQLVDIHDKATGNRDAIVKRASENERDSDEKRPTKIVGIIESHPVISTAILGLLVVIIGAIVS
ncbi:hypothetical protein A9Q96_06580 [Rhodobacterales bacterium 52_120_T64]|nr:hypothetical protein A9Q96_06580 [Rhodobacterales bacterium 52_120_T64]